MAICYKLRKLNTRRCGKNTLPARTIRADAMAASCASRFREHSGRVAQTNLDNRQMCIAVEVARCDLDFDVGLVSGTDRDGFRQDFSGEHFLRSADAQGAMRMFFVVPSDERIQSALDASDIPAEQGESGPELKASKKSFDPAIQKWCPYPRANMTDALPSHCLAELLAELRSVIRDQKRGTSMPGGGIPHQCDHIPGARSSGINLQCQNLTRESVQNSGDEECEPQRTDLRDVAMPDMVGLLRLQQAMRDDADGFSHRRPGASGWAVGLGLAHYALHSRPADFDTRPHEVPGDGAGSEFLLWKHPAQFLRRPTDGIVNFVPDNRSGQERRLTLSLDRSNPGSQGIGMDNEIGGGLLDTPASQAHQLDNLQPLRGCEVSAPMRRVVGQ